MTGNDMTITTSWDLLKAAHAERIQVHPGKAKPAVTGTAPKNGGRGRPAARLPPQAPRCRAKRFLRSHSDQLSPQVKLAAIAPSLTPGASCHANNPSSAPPEA
jgi:hypothetical protein